MKPLVASFLASPVLDAFPTAPATPTMIQLPSSVTRCLWGSPFRCPLTIAAVPVCTRQSHKTSTKFLDGCRLPKPHRVVPRRHQAERRCANRPCTRPYAARYQGCVLEATTRWVTNESVSTMINIPALLLLLNHCQHQAPTPRRSKVASSIGTDE
jgi:hypothetical protein